MLTSREIGQKNRQSILTLFRERPGIMSSEIAEALDLSTVVVGRHVGEIRKTWGAKEKYSPSKGRERPDKRTKMLEVFPLAEGVPTSLKEVMEKEKKTVATGFATGVDTDHGP